MRSRVSLAAPSFGQLSHVLGDVAAAGGGECDWLTALEALTSLLYGSTATIFLQHRADKVLDWVHQCGHFAPGAAYVDHYAKQDVLFPAVLKQPPARSVSNSQLVDTSDFARSESTWISPSRAT